MYASMDAFFGLIKYLFIYSVKQKRRRYKTKNSNKLGFMVQRMNLENQKKNLNHLSSVPWIQCVGWREDQKSTPRPAAYRPVSNYTNI